MRWVRFANRYWLEILIVAFAASLVLVTFFQVVNRFALHIPIAWTEEASRFLSIWTILLGAARGVRELTHIRVDFIVDRLPAAVQKVVTIATNLLCVMFLVVLLYKGVEILPIVNQRLSASLRLPLGYVYVAGPVSAAIMIWYFGVATWRTLTGGPSGAEGVSRPGAAEQDWE